MSPSDTTVHFHSGSNLANRLPEGAVTCSETWEKARDALVRTLTRDADSLGEQCEHENVTDGCASCTACADTRRVLAALEWTDCSLGFLDYDTNGSRARTYWITLVPAYKCEVDSDWSTLSLPSA